MRKSILVLIAIVVGLLISVKVAFGGQAKYIDDPNSYVLKLATDSYLTFNAPKRLFQVGKNEVDGHPAVRQGWGLGFIVSPHPTSRGADAMIYIEVLGHLDLFPGDPKDLKLAKWSADYAARLQETIGVRAMALDGDPLKPQKVALSLGTRNVEAYLVAYNCHPTNATATPKPGVGKAWIFDVDKVRVIITSEAMKERYDASSLLDKAFAWSKKPPVVKETTFKMLDTTMFVYRFMHMKLPSTCVPIYDDEMGVAAAWTVFNAKGEKVGILRFSGTFIEDKPLSEYVGDAYAKVGVGGATFYEKREKDKWETICFAKDGAGMAWKWSLTTSPTDDAKAFLDKIEEKNDQAKETAQRMYKATLDGLDSENYLLLHNILGTVFTWAVRS